MDKIISVKEGQIRAKEGGKSWIKLIDHEDKEHNIFPSTQDVEGKWIHLDKEIDMLTAKIEDETIGGLALKLTKEKKGKFWNVIAVEEVKDMFMKEALAKVTDDSADERTKTMVVSYAKDLACGNQIPVEQILAWADILYRWVKGDLFVRDEHILKLLSDKGGINEQPDKADKGTGDGRSASGETSRPAVKAEGDEHRGIETAGDLASGCVKHGKQYMPTWICKTLSEAWNLPINKMADIGILGFTFNQAYEKLKEVEGWK